MYVCTGLFITVNIAVTLQITINKLQRHEEYTLHI